MANRFVTNTLILNKQIVNATGNYLYVNGNVYPLSGDVSSTYATLTGLTATGATLISLINAASAGVSSIDGKSGILIFTGAGNMSILVNGQTFTFSGDNTVLSGLVINASGVLQTQINNLTTNLQTTGQTLYNDLIGISGQVVATGALFSGLSGALQATGTNLLSQINTVNTNQLNNSVAVSGNLQSTGQTLYNDIFGLSGQVVATGALLSGLSGALQATGTNLLSQINTVNTNQIANSTNLSGNLQTTGQTLFNSLVITSGNALANGTNLSGNLTLTGANLSAIKVTGSSIVNVANFTGIGGMLVYISGNNIVVFSGGGGGTTNNTFNNYFASGVTGITISGSIGITGLITITGSGINIIQSGNTIVFADITSGYLQQQINLVSINESNNATNLSGNLQTTGQNLFVLLTNASGQFNVNFATITNLQTTGQTLYNLLTNASGQFNTNFATVTNLQTTGQNLYNLITNFSGASDNKFATISNLQNTGQALYNLITNFSGASDNKYATITNLTQTGVTIEAQINSLSGYSNNTFATITNLQTTGQNAVAIANNNANNLSGNLTSTGTLLSAVKVTGSSIVNIANLTGVGGLIVYLSGNSIIAFSGGGGGNTTNNFFTTNGVTGISVTGSYPYLTGVITFTGIGGMIVYPSGNLIVLSGGGGQQGSTTNNYYTINSGSGAYLFRTTIAQGVSQQYVALPANLTGLPMIIATVQNNIDNTILPVQISGSTTSGFYAIFPNTTNNTGFFLNVLATSPNTGLALNVINQNTIYNITGISGLSVTGGPSPSSVVTLTGLSGTAVGLSGNNVITFNSAIPSINGVNGSIQLTDGLGNPWITSGQNILVGILNTGMASMTTNTIMASTGIVYQLFSGLIGSGKWVIEGSLNLRSTANAAFKAGGIITDGTNCYGYAEGFAAAAGAGQSGVLPLDFPLAFATFTQPTYVSMFAMSSLANTVACGGGTILTGLFFNNRFGNVGTQTSKISWMRIG